MNQGKLTFNVGDVTTVIASFAALAFCYGYNYQLSFLSEFGLGWWVEQQSVSALAIAGAQPAVLMLLYVMALVRVINYSERIQLYATIVSVVAYIAVLSLVPLIKRQMHVNLTQAIRWSEYLPWLMYGVAALGYSLAFGALTRQKVGWGLSLAFFSSLIFMILLPQYSAKIKSVKIIRSDENILPLVVSGDDLGWSVLAVNSSQAVLLKLEWKGLNSSSRTKFVSLDGVEVKQAQIARYQLVPE